MAQVDLDLLERDVASARERFASGISRLRNPAALSSFSSDVAHQASLLKNEVRQKATDATASALQTIWSDIKNRGMANPAAVFAIGAGLVWHLARHPPVTSLLVGLGLSSLMRTEPSGQPPSVVTGSAELAHTASGKIQEWGANARQAINSASDTTAEWAHGMRRASGEAISKVAAQASKAAPRQVISHSDKRDTYLLGFAALAIGAASVIAMQSQDDQLIPD